MNSDATWNHQVVISSNDYLHQHMTKNLYRFYCMLESAYDEETGGKYKTITYVHLVPEGSGKFAGLASKTSFYNQDLKTTYVNYITHDPEVFWQAPD